MSCLLSSSFSRPVLSSLGTRTAKVEGFVCLDLMLSCPVGTCGAGIALALLPALPRAELMC